MIWTIFIILIGFIIIRFITSLNKDNDDLHDKSLSDKFSVIVSALNDHAFNGSGNITTIDKRSFNLYQEGQNQILDFEYSTGHLTITWRYKYFQKELIHERQIRNVRNLSLFEQQRIVETIIKEIDWKIEQHKNLVLKDTPKAQIQIEPIHIKAFKESLESSLRDLMNKNMKDSQQLPKLIQRINFIQVANTFSEKVKENYNGFKQDSENRKVSFLSESAFNDLIVENKVRLMEEFIEQIK